MNVWKKILEISSNPVTEENENTLYHVTTADGTTFMMTIEQANVIAKMSHDLFVKSHGAESIEEATAARINVEDPKVLKQLLITVKSLEGL